MKAWPRSAHQVHHDLPITEPPIDTKPETPRDPAGNCTADLPADAPVPDWPPQTATSPTVHDPDLEEFLQAIRDNKDPDSELVAITPETTP